MDVCTGGICQVLLVTALLSLSAADPELQVISRAAIRCADDKVIVACQFKSYPDGGVVEPAHPNNEWLNMTNVALSSGICSVSLSSKFQTEVAYLIACRMQETLDGPWIQKEGILYRNINDSLELKPITKTPSMTTSMTTSLPPSLPPSVTTLVTTSVASSLPPSLPPSVTTSPTQASIAGGGSLILSVNGTGTLTNCTFLIPGLKTSYAGVLSGATSCSATIARSVASDVAVGIASVFSGGVFSWALVAGKPNVIEPKLTLPNVTTLSVGDVYNASCRVAANNVAVWTLDSQVIYETNCFRVDEWSWSFQNSNPFVATFDRLVTWEFNGRRLGCHMKSTSAALLALDTSSTPLDVRFAPYLTGVTWNRTSGDFLEATVQVAANPPATISWTIGDLQGDAMPMETKFSGHFEGFQKIANASSDSLAVSIKLENSVGSTTSQLFIGPASDTTWLIVLSGVLGSLCLVLLVAVLVLVLLRYRGVKLGASSLRLREGSGRKAAESGLYAEAGEPVEYDDIWQWQPEYEDVDLPMCPPRNPPAQAGGGRE